MQDVVIIPTFDRPELLWLCLEYLAASPDSQRVQVRVYVDAHTTQSPPRAEIEEVLDKFSQLSIYVGFRHPHGFHGNSFNVLMAYKEAFESQAPYVFLVEDDVLIHPDFFAWHRQQQIGRQIGCSIAVTKGPQQGPYASLGVCFRRAILQLMMPHCQAAYFRNMQGYIQQRFESTHRARSVLDYEQDGLWARVLAGHKVVWATTPMAQHVGWYGYHRKKSVRPRGTLVERYQQVKYVLTDHHALRAWMKEFDDIYPIQTPCN